VNRSIMPLRKGGQLAFVAGGAAALSLLAAACGGGGGAATAKTQSTTATTAAVATGPTGTRPAAAATFTPAASGSIASIAGDVLEVRSESSGQTTVDVTPKTAITATAYVPLSDVTAGTCIVATGTKGAGGAVDAKSVIIEPATNGACGERGVGFTRTSAPGSGFRGTFPGRTSGTFPRTGVTVPTNEASATGKVTSVSGSTITIKGFIFSFSGRTTATTSGATPPTTAVAKTVTVTVGPSTKYSKTGKGTVHSLKLGECAIAFGSTNDIGVVTATRLSVSPATSSGCSVIGGFGGGGFGGGGFGGGGSGFRGGLGSGGSSGGGFGSGGTGVPSGAGS